MIANTFLPSVSDSRALKALSFAGFRAESFVAKFATSVSWLRLALRRGQPISVCDSCVGLSLLATAVQP